MPWLFYITVQAVLIFSSGAIAICGITQGWPLPVNFLFAGMSLFLIVRSMQNPEYAYMRVAVASATTGSWILALPTLSSDLVPKDPPVILEYVLLIYRILSGFNYWVGVTLLAAGIAFGILDYKFRRGVKLFTREERVASKPHIELNSTKREIENEGTGGEATLRLDAHVELYNPEQAEITLTFPKITTTSLWPRRLTADLAPLPDKNPDSALLEYQNMENGFKINGDATKKFVLTVRLKNPAVIWLATNWKWLRPLTNWILNPAIISMKIKSSNESEATLIKATGYF